MDAKITLSFNADVITNAKLFAEKNKISLSRITEIFWHKMIDADTKTLDALPVSDWVTELIGNDPVYISKNEPTPKYYEFYESRYDASMVAEDPVEYKTKKKK